MDPTVTDWIVASTGVGTLGAAVTAGVYAKRAAHWTKAQAEAAGEQVQIARDALAVAQKDAADARSDAARQRAEAERSARGLAESRIDSTMPTVLARATPGVPDFAPPRPILEVSHLSDGGGAFTDWVAVDRQLEIRDGDDVLFRSNITIHLENISGHAAIVPIVDRAGGEVEGIEQPSTGVLVPPGEERTFVWTRQVTSGALRTDEGISENWLMNMRLWVRDLGQTAYDELLFNASLGHFARDGTRLIVHPELPNRWTENLGERVRRVYDRLDAEAASTR